MTQLFRNMAVPGFFLVSALWISGIAHADTLADANRHTVKADDSTTQPTATEEADDEAGTDVEDGDYSGDDSDDTATE